jgi:hypothetical protein
MTFIFTRTRTSRIGKINRRFTVKRFLKTLNPFSIFNRNVVHLPSVLGLDEVCVDERLAEAASEVAKAEGGDLEGLVAAVDADELRLLGGGHAVEGVASIQVADQSGSLEEE